MDFFEVFNQQMLKNELIKVNEEVLASYGISISYLEDLFKKHGLNINNLYISNHKSPEAHYLGEYTCSDVMLIKEVLENDYLGVNRIAIREQLSKDMFNNKQYFDLFNAENNKMALYYFLKLYKDIEKKYVFDVFISVYQQIHYGFEKISEDVYTYIKDCRPPIECMLNKMISNGEVSPTANINTRLTLYRAQGVKSTQLEKAKSWTLSLDFAKRMNTKSCGHIYKATVKICDIICYVDDQEHEILVDYDKLSDVVIFS